MSDGPTIEIPANYHQTMDELGQSLERGLRATYTDLVLEVHWRLAQRTPVLTGRARGNWRVGINAIDSYTDWSVTDTTGADTAAEAREIARNLQLGDTAYISNALPYIWPLNNGHSQKAPAGWIDQTAAEVPFIAQQLGAGLLDRMHGRSSSVGVAPA